MKHIEFSINDHADWDKPDDEWVSVHQYTSWFGLTNAHWLGGALIFEGLGLEGQYQCEMVFMPPIVGHQGTAMIGMDDFEQC